MANPRTRIYLVRHGETASNVTQRFRGRADIPLNERGRKQIRLLADALNCVPFSAVYSSPLSRSMETAEAIALTRCLEVQPHPAFQNIDLGEWTDRPKSEIQEEYPELWKEWNDSPEGIQLPGGEKVSGVRERSFRGLERLCENHRGETFAIVSHRAVLKPLCAAILGMDAPYFWRLHLDTAGYSVFERGDKGYILRHFNQTSHLNGHAGESF